MNCDALGSCRSSSSPLSFQAFRNLKTLAEKGDPVAQDKLGAAYGNGNGVPQDGAESLRWYNKAAQQGNADAQFHLGLMYDSGAGVSPDYREAARWWYEAADQGDADAMFQIGRIYHCGKGIHKNVVLASRWYSKATRQSPSYPEFQGNENDYAEKLGWHCPTQNLARAEVESVIIHSNAPFRPNRAQYCSILTGKAPIEGGPRVKVEMDCSERTDFDPAKSPVPYPYTRIATVKLDEPAWKEFNNLQKWKVDLYCQDVQGSLGCRLPIEPPTH
jgi:hypothetical protein